MRRSESPFVHHLTPRPAAPEATSRLSVLVVEPCLNETLLVMTRLTTAGFDVTVAETFVQAKPLLSAQPPAVLLTAVRLGAHNGLHLVLRGKSTRPEMAALVTAPHDDVVLRADAEAMGATFLVTPLGERDLIAAVLQTFFRRDHASGPIRPPFERRVGERRLSGTSSDHERRSSDRRKVLPWLATGARSMSA
jgi:DNA-binding NtrC family response regulator